MNDQDNIDEEKALFLIHSYIPWFMIIRVLSWVQMPWLTFLITWSSVSCDPKENQHRTGKFKLGKEVGVLMILQNEVLGTENNF